MTHFYLMAYFHPENRPAGEQVRFAVSETSEPTSWVPLNDGEPCLVTRIGESGARDPFLFWDHTRQTYVLLATDLRIGAGGDWLRATRNGSRSILVWQSPNLLDWEGPALVPIAPANAGNAWAPKAVWDDERCEWLVFFTAPLFDSPERTGDQPHQRILVAATRDFTAFGQPETYKDYDRDVIDMAFVEDRGSWYRFSVVAHGDFVEKPGHILVEHGSTLRGDFAPSYGVGSPELVRAEGPAPFSREEGGAWLLLDEFGMRGYQLFESPDLAKAAWAHREDAVLPPFARHGSVIEITAGQRADLIRRFAA